MASLACAEKPLPDPRRLVETALQNQNVFANKRSDYVCTYTNHIIFGSHRERLYEVLFINGYETARLVAENGKPLPTDRTAEEETRLNRAIAEAEKRPPPPFTVMDGGWTFSRAPHSFSQTVEGAIMRFSTFDHERRITYRGRPAIEMEYHGNGNKELRPQTDEERAAQAFDGNIIIDEEDQAVVRIGGAAERDAWNGHQLLVRNSHILGFDEVRVDEGFYLPLAWVVAPLPTDARKSYGVEDQDFWLQGCRKYRVQSRVVP